MGTTATAARTADRERVAPQEHQVLYRKFRPRQFADVVGQDHVTGALRQRLAEGRVPHALLFTGSRGCGKTTSARLVAAALNCPNVSDGEPCGGCSACNLIISGGGAIGVVEVDGASKRGIGEMKDLIDSMGAGSVAAKKVYIIDEAHMLTKEASNALLKTLEEPPADTVIILCTTEPARILDTIRSRTVSFNFRDVPADILTGLVRDVVEKAGLDLDEDAIAEVVRRGHGSPRDTLTALEGFGGPDDTDDLHTRLPVIAAAVAEKNTAALVLAIADAINAGIAVPELTRSLLEHWRNCLLALEAPAALQSHDSKAVEALAKQAKALKANRVVRLLNTTAEALGKMTATGDARVLLETTLLQVALPSASDSLDGVYDMLEDLLDEIEDLKDAVRSAPAAPAPAAQQEVAWPPAPAPEPAPAPAPAEKDEPEAEERPADPTDDAESTPDAPDLAREDDGAAEGRGHGAESAVEEFGDGADEEDEDDDPYSAYDDPADDSAEDDGEDDGDGAEDDREPVLASRFDEPDPEHTHDDEDASGFLDCPHPACLAKAKELAESEKAVAKSSSGRTPRDEPAKEPKKKFFEEDDAPTARDLVEAIQFSLIERKYARYLQDTMMDAELDGDVLVMTLRKDATSLPPSAAIDALLACGDHLWVEEIEYVGEERKER